jgi:hypothetical protein
MENNTMSQRQIYLKEYREKNKDKVKEYKRKSYEKNKEKIKEKRTEKVKCEICGYEVQKRQLTNHKKTKKCQAVKEHIISLMSNETN